MSAPRAFALLPALLAAGAALAAAEAGPAASLLLAVRAGPRGAAVAPAVAEACRAGLEREGFAVLAAAEPAAAPEALLAEAGRRGADWVVGVTVSRGREIVIEAALSSAADGARVATVTISGPEDLGLEHKALRVAQELGARIRSLPAAVVAAAPAAHAPAEPAGALASPAAPAPAPAPAPAGVPAPAPALPSPSAEVLRERARLEQARARLRRDLEETQRGRRKATVRAALTWGAGAAALAVAGAAWWSREEESDNRESLTWIAAGAGAVGGLCAVGGTIFWLTRPDPAPIERALSSLDEGLGK